MTLGSFTATTPWLGHHDLLAPPRLAWLAASVVNLPLGGLFQAKAFCPGNSADIFFAEGNEGLSWICFGESCRQLAQQAWDDPDATLADAIQHAQAPVSARVASRRVGGSGYTAAGEGEARAVTPQLVDFLAELDAETKRPFCDADVYCTPPGGMSTASLG